MRNKILEMCEKIGYVCGYSIAWTFIFVKRLFHL